MREPAKTLRVIITDDEPHARYLIRHLLSTETDIKIVGEAEDAAQAVDLIRSTPADLIFLDIQLPGDGAFSIIREVGPAKMPRVIFVTAHRQHAVQAFDLPAVDYLLKPVDPDRFRQSVQRVREEIVNGESVDVKAIISRLKGRIQKASPERIKVYDRNNVRLVRLQDVIWLKAEGNYTRVFLKDSNYKVRNLISDLEKQLPAQFSRIHRSIIVNLDYMKETLRLPHGEYRLILHNGTKLPLSRKYRKLILDVRY